MDVKRLAILGTLLVLLVILIVVFFTKGGKEKAEQAQIYPSLELDPTSEESGQKKSVVLFFLSERDALLHPEEREIYASPSVIHEAKQVIEELIRGSQNGFLSPLPPQTRLRELYLPENGIVYIDFSKDFQGTHPSGSSAEISTIYSIVNSLTYNFRSIKRVFFLVEGGEKETLGGHINLNVAFLPQYSLISK